MTTSVGVCTFVTGGGGVELRFFVLLFSGGLGISGAGSVFTAPGISVRGRTLA